MMVRIYILIDGTGGGVELKRESNRTSKTLIFAII